ncbi:MAG TPA: EpsG family protein [Steroidobacteraceae bacterium]|nr:EpsG family protein [Steroidobacteraceae bacterium]
MKMVPSLTDQRASSLFVIAGLAAASAAFFSHPLALLIFACMVPVIAPTDDLKWLFIVSSCALFLTLNVSRLLDGDLVLYARVQEYLSQQPLAALLDKEALQELSGTYRVTEAGFYVPMWLISIVIPDSKTAICVAATLGTYVPTFLGVLLIGRSENWSKGAILLTLFFTFFAGINFVQSTHLIRQYISTALLFYAFAHFIAGHKRWAAVIAFASCTVHNGTAPLLVMLAGICWLFRYREDRKIRMGVIGLLLRLVGSLMVMFTMMAIIPIVQGEFFKEKDVPNIKWYHFAVVGALLLITHLAIRAQRLHLSSLYYARVASVTIFIASLGFFFAGLPLFALRYFAYLEWLYGLMVGGILFSLFRNRPELRVFVRFVVSLAAAAIFVGRVAASEWTYGPGNNSLLSWDFFEVAQLVSR